MVLFLHNRYRTSGGEERAVADLLWLVREQMGEPAELLTRSSDELGRGRAAIGLLRGGLQPELVAGAVRSSGARVVHAHNLHPALGWRALAAARSEGARIVLHLHQYRLVCAIGVCFTRGAECTRCHGRNTLAGVRLNCRQSVPEAAAYGVALSLWQRRLVDQADVVIVPSAFARARLAELGAPLPWDRVHVLPPPVRIPPVTEAQVRPPDGGGYALVVSRLAPEKGVDVAIDACRLAGMPLIVAGDGPEREALVERGAGADVRFVGRVGDGELADLRAGAAVALVPSRSGETFGLAAAEAMAMGLPVLASRVGSLPELVAEEGLLAPGDPLAMAAGIERLAGDRAAGERGRARVLARCAPQVVAGALGELYGGSRG
jgi:glycosyltransferase involved in cell wall biosynthesis